MKKRSVYALTGALALTLAFATAAVVNPQTAEAKKVKVKKVTVAAPSGKTAYVAKGKKVKLAATVKVTPNKKANKKVTYKSANKKIATVNSKGVMKGLKAGKTKIVVTSKKNRKKKATIKVVVKKAPVKKVKLNTKNFVLSTGSSKKLGATVTPKKNTCTKVVWSSSNEKVAKVSSKGVVKALKEGKATITAKAADGSNKKAKVTVTVGSGIASVSVPTSRVVRVTLSGVKALSAKDFAVQTRSGQTSSRYTTLPVDSVSTRDQKVYDISLKSYVSARSYLKVTIPALATNKSLEVYVDKIADYGYATNDTVRYISYYNKGEWYSSGWDIENSNAVGKMTYSVEGLPAGLKAYISQDQTEVRVCGKFANVENGTTAILKGVDEKGTTFTEKMIFYVGDADHLVGGAEAAYTALSYVPDDPKTWKDEESGFYLSNYMISNFVHVGGGSGDYMYDVKWNGKDLDALCYDADYNRVAIPTGTYNFDVTVKDENNENLSMSTVVTIVLKDGVVVSGNVRDLSGQPAKDISVRGYTKMDAYGRCQSLDASTEKDGTYTTRVLPGDYYTYCYDGCDMTVGNIFNSNATKNFVIPRYLVKFAINVPGVAGYVDSDIRLVDSYGSNRYVSCYYGWDDGDFSPYVYLEPGSYAVSEDFDYYADNTIDAYGKIEAYDNMDGTKRYYLEDRLGRYKVSGSFNVSGAGTITLNATKYIDTDDDYE